MAKEADEFINPTTGNLDIDRIAAFFGLDTATLLQAVDATPAAYKSPHAKDSQEPLRLYAEIASGLISLLGSALSARVWLHAPNPALDNHAPVDLLKENVDALVDFVDDLLHGQPA